MRRAIALLAVVGAAALPATPAAAATDFGASDMSQAPANGCAAYPCSVTGGPSAGAPVAGVLTSVRVRYAGDGATGVVHVLRPAGGDSFLDVGPDIPITLPASSGATFSFAARQPIAAGDRLALGANSSFADDSFQAASGDCMSAGEHEVGSTISYSPCSGEPLVQGTVEPDSNGDGYGDDTQDGDLALSGAVAPAAVLLSEPATYTFVVTNNGTSPAQNTGVKVPVRKDADLASVSASPGFCGGVRAAFCWIGTLEPGASATVRVEVVPHAPGTLTLRSSAVSTTPDPNALDNSAAADLTVTDPFAGVPVTRQRVAVEDERARIVHDCPSDTAGYCRGEVVLSSAAAPRLGEARFHLQPGARARVPVRLTGRALRLLERGGRIDAVAATHAVDGVGTERNRTGRVRLTMPNQIVDDTRR